MSEQELEPGVDETPGSEAVPAGQETKAEPAKAAPANAMAGDDGDDDRPPATQAKWPDNWRDELAGGDEKLRKRLERFTTPDALAKSYRELEAKISSGAIKKALGPDATDEEVAAWRKENGIPEKPDGYKFDDLGGYVLTDDDKPLVDDFRATAHKLNLKPEEATELVKWFTQKADAERAALNERDSTDRAESTEELRAEWAGEFRANRSAIKNFMDMMVGEDLSASIFEARMPDGSKVGNNTAILKSLAQAARNYLPGADLMPAGTADVAKGIDGRLEEIAKYRRENFDAYQRDDKVQAEELKLIEAKQRRQQAA